MASSPPLMPEQVQTFRRRGVLRLPAVVEPDAVALMVRAVWGFLADRDAVRRDDPTTWPRGPVRKLGPLARTGVFAPVVGPSLHPVFDQLLGKGSWDDGFPGGVTPLISFPDATRWVRPHRGWHMDLPARGRTDRLDALRVLGAIGTVAAQGGATLAVEGSHRLVAALVEAAPDADAGSSGDVRKVLSRHHAWFRGLETDPRSPDVHHSVAEVDGIEVRVRPLISEPGDVWLMHPWTLHSASPNVSDQPRMATTVTVYGSS